MIVCKDALLLLESNGRNGLDVLREATVFLGVTIAEDDLRLDLLWLRREHNLSVVFVTFTSILEIFDKDRTIG